MLQRVVPSFAADTFHFASITVKQAVEGSILPHALRPRMPGLHDDGADGGIVKGLY